MLAIVRDAIENRPYPFARDTRVSANTGRIMKRSRFIVEWFFRFVRHFMAP